MTTRTQPSNTPEPQPEEVTGPEPTPRLQHDIPRGDDALARRPLAQCLAGQIEQFPREGRNALFVHIDAASGAGKSSFLELLRQELSSAQQPQRDGEGSWHVVGVNATKVVEASPIWWALTNAVFREIHDAARASGSSRSGTLWRAEYAWRFRAGHGQLYFGATALGIGLLILELWNLADVPFIFQLIAAVLAIGGAFFGVRESLLSRPARSTTGGDRIGVSRHLADLVRKSGRRVAILVDELDQCPGDTGCELLRTLDATLRDVPVAVVVAADRRWLLAALERNAPGSADVVAEPGRSLGYQALTRMFDASISLPRVDGEVALQYWQSLVTGESAPVATPELVSQAVERPGLGKRGYLALGRVLDRHPRTMKRFPLAYAALRVIYGQAGVDLSAEQVAGWTILCLRWPLLAEYLAARPKEVTNFRYDAPPADVPDSIRNLFVRPQIVAIMRGLVPEAAFDERAVRLLVDPFANGGSRLGVS